MLDKKSNDLKKTFVSTTGLLVLLVVLILLNVILSYASVRWDTTEGKCKKQGHAYKQPCGNKFPQNDLG